MLSDACGLPLSTRSVDARDAYDEGLRRLLHAQPGSETALQRALEADPGFALAHAALARAHQAHGRGGQARAAMALACEHAPRTTERERGHVAALAHVVAGDAQQALEAVRAHLARWPRDRAVMAPATGVFGLFGFSGRGGRERALADFLAGFATDCGDDPWFLAARAFAQAEVGELDAARAGIERSLAAAPDNANAAHVRAHVDYESGEHASGRAWLRDWCVGYPQAATMHCHLHWHLALWALDAGDAAAAWATFEAAIAPDAAWGPPLNLVTDAASFLLRAELAGVPPSASQWQAVAAVARRHFPEPGVGFADAHVALACAMSGDAPGLARVLEGARGPVGDLVVALARAFEAWAQGDAAGTVAALAPLRVASERLGGSRAQRDALVLLETAAQARLGGVVPPRRPGARPP